MKKTEPSQNLTALRSDIEKKLIVLFKNKKINNVELDEETQFRFANSDETVKSLALDGNNVIVITEDFDEEIKYDLSDLSTDEILAVYDVMMQL